MLTIVFAGCSTNDLDPSLEQNKDAANGITNVDNLYAVLKGNLENIYTHALYVNEL